MKRYLKCFTGLLPLLAAVGIQLLISTLLSIFYMVIVGIQTVITYNFGGPKAEAADFMTIFENAMTQGAAHLISVIAIMVCGILFFFWYRFEIRGEIRGCLQPLFTLKNIFLFMLLGIGGQFLISGILGLVEPYFKDTFEEYAETIEILINGDGFVVLLLLVFVAPVAEELIFRGMVLHKASRSVPFWVANLFQAVLFGIYHWNIIQSIYAALLGYLLGMVYYKFKTIYASIFLHMMFNASSLIMMIIPEMHYTNILLVLMGTVLVGPTIYLLMPFSREEDRFPVIDFKAKTEEVQM